MLLAIALLLGGGGVAYGLHNLAIQIAGLLVLAWQRKAFVGFWSAAPLSLRLLCGGTIALPLLQMVPLPPSLWEMLPARELASEALAAAGLAPGWRPLSLDPARTLVAGLGLIVPLAILATGWTLARETLIRTGWLAVALGLVHFAWGIPQVLSQGALGVPYREISMPGVLFGGFANRNSTGLFFVMCLALALGLDPPRRLAGCEGLLRLALTATFVLAVVLTQSRSAMALCALPLGLAVLRLFKASSWARPALLSLAGVVVCGVALQAISPANRITTAIDRFSQGDGHRAALWQDTAVAAQRYWPAGSGMGTFDEVIQLDESLEDLAPRTAGRAHNDYLEWAIEGGLPAMLLALAWLVVLARLAWQARHSPYRWTAWTGGTAMLAIALQSLTDYPLRNQALLAMAALALLLLARPARQGDRP